MSRGIKAQLQVGEIFQFYNFKGYNQCVWSFSLIYMYNTWVFYILVNIQ